MRITEVSNPEQKEQFWTTQGWFGGIWDWVGREWRENQEEGNSTEGGGLEAKNRTFASFPVGAATLSCKDFVGLLCMKSGKLHISGLSNLSQPIADFTSLSSPHLKRKEWSVMWAEHRCQLSACPRREESQMLHSCPGLPQPTRSSVQFSWLFSIWENFYSLQILVSPIK